MTNINSLQTTSVIDYQRQNALILNQILLTILKRNVWRSAWRIRMWVLGLKGIITMQPLVVEGRIIFSVVVRTFSFHSEQSFWQRSLFDVTYFGFLAR